MTTGLYYKYVCVDYFLKHCKYQYTIAQKFTNMALINIIIITNNNNIIITINNNNSNNIIITIIIVIIIIIM